MSTLQSPESVSPMEVDPLSPRLLPKGSAKRIHVNQRNLRRRVKGVSSDPCYTVKYQGRTYWAEEIEILGPCQLLERIDNPLSCGARLWIETTAAVWLLNK